jgi:hypothetical protein
MNFGVFNIFWDQHPNHLPFLNLMESAHDPKEWNLQISISKLDSILETNSKEQLSEGINLLLQSKDWRPHLVAIISLLTFEAIEREKLINQLWERLAYGSWISPQILVVLSLIDRNFISKAERLLDEEFKVNFTGTSSIEHYVSHGGITTGASKLKIIGAIHYLLGKTLDRENDLEQGGAIAKSWSDRLFELSLSKRLQIQTL